MSYMYRCFNNAFHSLHYLIIPFLMFFTNVVNGKELFIYMSPFCSDMHNGRTLSQSVCTLQKALTIAAEQNVMDVDVVTIKVSSGRYIGQVGEFSYVHDNTPSLKIIGAINGGRSEFLGEGTSATWFKVNVVDIPVSGIAVGYISIKGYSTAISLNGSRNVSNHNISNVVIRDMEFIDIGQLSMLQAPSTASVRLVNTDAAQLLSNRFENTKNLEGCQLIHAVYLAHGSNGNIIKDNYFKNSCGDSIRIRDDSGKNIIKDNLFVDAWADAPISDWYCDSTSRNDCTKKTPECPSFGNKISGNRVVSHFLTAPLVVKAYGSNVNLSCPSQLKTEKRQRFVAG